MRGCGGLQSYENDDVIKVSEHLGLAPQGVFSLVSIPFFGHGHHLKGEKPENR